MAESCLKDICVWTPTPLFLMNIKKMKPLNSILHTWGPVGLAAICNSRTFPWHGAGLGQRRGAHSFFSPYQLTAVQNEGFLFLLTSTRQHIVSPKATSRSHCTQNTYKHSVRSWRQWLFSTGGSESKAARGRSASSSHCANSRLATKLPHLFKNVSSVF